MKENKNIKYYENIRYLELSQDMNVKVIPQYSLLFGLQWHQIVINIAT